jgi:hypothetical protein
MLYRIAIPVLVVLASSVLVYERSHTPVCSITAAESVTHELNGHVDLMRQAGGLRPGEDCAQWKVQAYHVSGEGRPWLDVSRCAQLVPLERDLIARQNIMTDHAQSYREVVEASSVTETMWNAMLDRRSADVRTKGAQEALENLSKNLLRKR